MQKVTIGDVQVTPLLDTGVLMNPVFMFKPDQAEQFVKEWGHRADNRGLYPMSITCFLVRSAGKNILIDTGIGPRRRQNFPIGHLPDALSAAGVAPDEIDLVVATHLHIDHVGWNTYEDDRGETHIFFPKAKFVVQATEWDHWMQPQYLDAPEHAHLRECVLPLKDTGQVEVVTGEQPLDEHITFIPAPGHTPGHVAMGIYSQGERGVIIGDASHHPVQLDHPDWSPGVDSDPVQSAQTRDRLFNEAADDGRMWIAGHWEHPGLGRIVRLNGKRVFQAL